MARRCGCAGSVCSCFVTGTGNATVTGQGSEADPYVVDVDAAVIQVTDTATLDLVITGAGTPASPYVLSGNVLGGGGGGLTNEQMMDFLGGVTTAGAGILGAGMITVTYSDTAVGGAGTITISTVHTEAFLLSRANHTGEVPLSSMASDWMVAGDPSGTQIGRVAVWDGNSWEHQDALTGKADKGSSIAQFVDWADSPAPSDDDIPVWDGSLNQYVPTDLSTRFAAADTTTGDLLYTAFAPFMGLMFIKNEGDPDPAGLPLGLGIPIVGFQRPAAPSIVPIYGGASGSVVAGATMTVTFTQNYAVGEDLVMVIGASGEVGSGGFPAEISVTPTGYAAPLTLRIRGAQAGTAQCAIYQGKVTTAIDSGDSAVVHFRDTTNATDQNRAHGAVVAMKIPGLAATPFDQSAQIGQGGSGVLNLSVGPTGALAVPNEVAIMGIYMSGGANPSFRSIAGTNGWVLLANLETDAGTGSRILYVFYKVVSTTASVTGTATVTSTDGQTGANAMALATFKAA